MSSNLKVFLPSFAVLLLAFLWMSSDLSWPTKIAYSSVSALGSLIVLKFLWKGISYLRKKRAAAKDRKNKKIRLWNKLSGLQTPLKNIENLCVRHSSEVSELIAKNEVSAVDVLEAFQAKSILLDDAAPGSISEFLYDADVHAFLLDAETLDSKPLLGLCFYFNGSVKPSDSELGLGKTLMDAGSLPLALVSRKMLSVASMLLNHGANFFVGLEELSGASTLVRDFSKKPVCALVTPRGLELLVVAAADAETVSRVGRSLSPIPIEDVAAGSLNVCYIFLNQRKSSSIGSILSPDSLKASLASVGHCLVEVEASEIAGESADVAAAVQGIFKSRRADALIISAGSPTPALGKLVTSLNVFVVPLQKELTTLYIFFQDNQAAQGHRLVKDFGKLF